MSAGFIDIVTNDTDENGVTTERRIHLNNPDGIFHIREWKPLAPPPEDLYQFSPFEDGRVLAMRKYGNVADEWVMDASGADSNLVDLELEALRALLKKAVDYWIVDWQMEPVWIEMRGDGEANIRYSYVYAWDVPEEANPFANPRNECPSLIPEFPLRIEHGFWLSALAGECVQLSATQDYYTVDEAQYTPAQSSDDGYVNHTAGTITLNSFLQFGLSGAPALDESFARFLNLTVPPDATIVNAYIQMRAQSSLAGATCRIRIYGEADDSPATFSTYANYNGRVRTAAFVNWTVPAFVVGTDYQTPNLMTIIQEIVNRPGYLLGNPIALFLQDNVSDAGAYRTAQAWDGAPDPILHIEWYSADGTFGMTESCNPVYFADRHNKAQLTHAFYYDDSAGTYSTNLIGAALPYALFPAVPAVPDILYLIVDSLVADSGPFGSTVFDLSVIDAGMVGVWEYWNGAWVSATLGTNDFTNGFRNLGINIVNWEQNTDWVTATINFITGYIIRFRVTAVGAGRPTQQNRQLYAVNTPYVEIADSRVDGDIAMLCEPDIYELHAAVLLRQCQIIYAGLRSLKRGLNFSAYVNIADEQTPTGLSFSLGLNSSWIADASSETGRACYWNPTTTGWESIIDIIFTTALSQEYAGSFMSYLRSRISTFSNLYWFKYQLIIGGQILFESMVFQPLSTTLGSNARITIANLGEIITSIDPKSQPVPLTVRIYGMTSNAANDCYLHTLIMIPNDEWIGNYDAYDYHSGFYSTRHLNVDPITQIKLPDVAIVRADTNNDGVYNWNDKSPHFPKLWEYGIQRLWFFHPGAYGSGTSLWYTACTHSGKITLKAIKKYFGSWG